MVETPAADHNAIFRTGGRFILEERKCATTATVSRVNTIMRNLISGALSSSAGMIDSLSLPRHGRALRFAEQEGGPFLREEGVKRIPPLVELPKLLAAAEHLMED
jgi:hypothetical protein